MPPAPPVAGTPPLPCEPPDAAAEEALPPVPGIPPVALAPPAPVVPPALPPVTVPPEPPVGLIVPPWLAAPPVLFEFPQPQQRTLRIVSGRSVFGRILDFVNEDLHTRKSS
jgi:hypothetical protein